MKTKKSKVVLAFEAVVVIVAMAFAFGISGVTSAEVKSPKVDVKQVPWPMKCVSEDDFHKVFGVNFKLLAEHVRELKDGEVVERRRVVMDPRGRIIIYIRIEGTNRQFDHCVLDLWPEADSKITPPGAGDPA